MKWLLFLTLSVFCFADSYSDKAEGYSKRDYDETYSLISRCLGNYFSGKKVDESTVLDLGCGTGSSTRLLKSFGFGHVLGIDPSAPMIDAAKNLDPEGHYSTDFDWKGKFDFVSSSFVLPVLTTEEDISSHLKMAYSALKEGGFFIIVTAASEAFHPKHSYLSWEQDFPENYTAVNGDSVRVRLKKGDLLLEDTLWTAEFLQKMFEDHSFEMVHLFKPLGQSDEPFAWNSELTTAPFDIYILRKQTHVGVFCATDEQIPDLYKNLAHELGQALYENGFSLITGGGNSGLMNAVVNGFVPSEKTNRVGAFIPSVFKSYNVHHPKIPEANLVWTDTIHERLQGFHDHCDAVVVLPGGIGTLQEFLDFVVPKQWGLHDKKIILFNCDHYWDYQLLQFQVMVEKNALKQKHLDLFTVVTTTDECIRALQSHPSNTNEGLNDRYWETK